MPAITSLATCWPLMAMANPTKPALEMANTGDTPSRASEASAAMAKIATVAVWPSIRATASARWRLRASACPLSPETVQPDPPTPLRSLRPPHRPARE